MHGWIFTPISFFSLRFSQNKYPLVLLTMIQCTSCRNTD